MSDLEQKKTFIPAADWTNAILPILREGHTLRIPLSGLSMRPLLVGGRDEVVLSSISGRRVRRGDIVLYSRTDGTHVLHRVVRIKGDSYYMLGDAHTWIEGPIEKENALAVAVTVIRKGREIQCRARWYRAISGLWLLLRPVRPFVYPIAARLIKLVRQKN